jgi:outer membrane protein TolC
MLGRSVAHQYGARRCVVGTLLLALGFTPAQAFAQELGVFLEAAKKANFDAREASAISRQRDAEASQTTAGLFPTLTARGTYTRNQFAAEAIIPTTPGAPPEKLTIFPRNQLDGYLELDVPVVDLTRWAQIRENNAHADAARHQRDATNINVEGQVVQAYYNLLGAQALVRASQKSIDATEVIVARTHERVAAGVASPVDEARAVSELSLKRRTLADAVKAAADGARLLRTLTSMEPGELVIPPRDDLHPEPPPEAWIGKFEGIPAVQAAKTDAKAAKIRSDSAWTVFVPTVSIQLQEHFTNATGFQNASSIFTGVLALTERLDWSAVDAARAARAASDASQARAEKATQNVRDTIYSNWQQVNALIARAASARAAKEANEVALRILRDRYDVGTATSLELSQADRDLFSATASAIQAEADLATARAFLRLSAGYAHDAPAPAVVRK